MFGGTLERYLVSNGIVKATNLTNIQRQLPVCRNVAMSGAVIGIIVGCVLGASSLLLIDLDGAEKSKQNVELLSTIDRLVRADDVGADSCKVYLADGERAAEAGDNIGLEVLSLKDAEVDSCVELCSRTRKVINSAALDVERYGEVNLPKVSSALCVPVFSANGDLHAAIEFTKEATNIRNEFLEENVNIAKLTSRYVGVLFDKE